MTEEPSANITCYFINFKRPIIINVYDDRGMDIYSPDKMIIDELLISLLLGRLPNNNQSKSLERGLILVLASVES